MIIPRKWIKWRPGFIIPVFFLSFCQMSGQESWPDAASAALGRCYVTRSGVASAGLNQAGLGQIDKNSCSFHHIRPFITSDLDIVSLSVQLALKHGGPGLSLSTMGITGMRQTSAWFSYGLMLHPHLFAGVGISLKNTGIAEEAYHKMGAGFALGLQFQVNNELLLGAHLSMPAAWPGSLSAGETHIITSGLSYLFYNTARYHTEFQVTGGGFLRWGNGLEITISDTLLLELGISNQPWSLSSGISISHKKWVLNLAGVYCLDTGITPYTTLSYVW
jgi:hypothetical protein